MYCLSTAHLALSLQQNLIAFFDQHAADGGLTILNDQGHPLVYCQITIEVINDSIVCWRTWVLWGRSYKVVAPPALCIIGGFACGIGVIRAFVISPPGEAVYSPEIVRWFSGIASLTCIANLYAVSAISYKAWYVLDSLRVLKNSAQGHGYHRTILLTFIESGAVYSVALVSLARSGIYPTGIIVLVALNLTFHDDMTRSSKTLTSLQCAPDTRNSLGDSRPYGPTVVHLRGNRFQETETGDTPVDAIEFAEGSAVMASSRHPEAYVRVAKPSDNAAVTRVLTRAFAKDPAMNWYGGVTKLVEDIDSPLPKDARTMRNLSWFQEALVRLTVVVEGVVTVVAIPRTDNKATPQADTTKGEDTPDEEIVAVSLWLPPGKTLDVGPVTVFRSGLLKVLTGWGYGGVKRVLFEFSPAVERSLEKSFKARGLERLDSWHLLTVVVDPDHQKKGYSSMLMEEGFRRTSPKPVHLEATTPANRDIYAHLGFEIDEVHQFGVGQVDKDGIRAKGEAATGYPEWIMTKVRYPSSQLVICNLTTPASPQWST
ncbi:hypothetical protein K466DRAFT_482487 [Polyporus arcularius HHB13444]|uniref:Uncharacterized protein n=1 Tax=Polyporus arcularius HHB13444 TaxID=1314778 RepID=A0A5C3PT89_9APHY|nr:hypothetical protein K466DRAFT_482487 [Polyporus arcularius HHB13444]